MAEIRVNSTGGVKLFDADDSHYAQIKAGTISSNTDVLELGSSAVVAGTKVDLNGQELILDADADTSITADTDDQIDVRIAGADDFQFTANTFTAQSGSSIIVPNGGLTFGSTAISSTAAELNLLDGGTSVGSSITLADADGFVVNDGGTMKTIPASDINTYASGNLVKISSGTWNASTDTLSLSNVFTTTYKHYVFYLTNVIPSANAGVNMQLETGGSGSYVTGSSYHYVLIGRDSSGNLTNTQDNNSSNIEFQAQAILGGHGSKRGNYIVDFFNPMDGNCYTTVNTQATYHDADGATEFNKGAGAYLANTAVTGFRVLLSSGNIDTYAANYALYGLKA